MSYATKVLMNNETAQSIPMQVNFHELTDAALQALDARSRDIIVRRFGLGKEEKETLESIGKEYGITRERVRQIEANAKKELTTMKDLFVSIEKLLLHVFQEYGGLLSEEHAVSIIREKTHADVSSHMLHFYLTILPQFAESASTNLFEDHWKHEESLHNAIEQIVLTAMDVLKEKNAPMELHELTHAIEQRLQGSATHPRIHAALTASKHVSPTAFGDWGLIGWAETSPRGVGDKAFAVLRRHGKPAHFREITQMINTAAFDHKVANPQTVHNELIKDGRFVLVGRGLYGLKEMGYVSGTVADVLEEILATAEKPLSKQELVDAVLKQRIVKKNTILLSLQNTKRFSRVAKDLYTLKK